MRTGLCKRKVEVGSVIYNSTLAMRDSTGAQGATKTDNHLFCLYTFEYDRLRPRGVGGRININA